MLFNTDSIHETAENVHLFGNAELHRFLNPACVPYSAIYLNGKEVWSCERKYEQDMIQRWNSNDNEYVNVQTGSETPLEAVNLADATEDFMKSLKAQRQ